MRGPLIGLIALAGCAAASGGQRTGKAHPVPSRAFWDHWSDGQAELNAYRLVQPRYGELRTGEAVLIYVTETFTESQRVKSDGGHPDEFPVFKLNEARDFQTGIYDYHAMTSVFSRLDGVLPPGQPAKLSLSVQEWCGHVYEQLQVDPGSFRQQRHSYFDGEADLAAEGEIPAGAVLADSLPILVRGLTGGLPDPGQSIEVPFLPSLLQQRLDHEELEWGRAQIERSAGSAPVEVPAGRFDAYTVTIREQAGATTSWTVESEWPHRLVAWESDSGERAELMGSMRSAYWRQHREGYEDLRADLGLPARSWQWKQRG